MLEADDTTSAALIDALTAAARGCSQDLASCLVKTSDHAVLDETNCACHCYHVKLDGNGRPMVTQLIQMLITAIVDNAIPRRRVVEAKRRFDETQSSDAFVRLATQAKALFTDVELTGEGGELLLFLFAEKVLGLPQLFSKMSLKTSNRHHVTELTHFMLGQLTMEVWQFIGAKQKCTQAGQTQFRLRFAI